MSNEHPIQPEIEGDDTEKIVVERQLVIVGQIMAATRARVEMIAEKAKVRLPELLAEYALYLRQQGKESEGDAVLLKLEQLNQNPEYLDEKFKDSFVDTLVSSVGALAFTYLLMYPAITVWLGTTVGPEEAGALLASIIAFEAIPGLGGGPSLVRAVYFLVTMGIPLSLEGSSKKTKEISFFENRVLPLLASFATSFDGGYVIAPFLRFAVEDRWLRNALVWDTKRNLKEIPKKIMSMTNILIQKLSFWRKTNDLES